jgi:peptidoglycan/LPS O-acetylase OafA/YrhL
MAPTANRGHYKRVVVVVSAAFIAATAAALVGVLSIEKPIRRASQKRRRRVVNPALNSLETGLLTVDSKLPF